MRPLAETHLSGGGGVSCAHLCPGASPCLQVVTQPHT